MILIVVNAAYGQLSLDRIGDDQFHTNYVDYNTDGDRTPTCTSGDPVRVQRSIDYSTCRNKAEDPCGDCEIYRIRYERASQPCVEEDQNFKERFEEDQNIWNEKCPCYPNCNSSVRITVHGLVSFAFVVLLFWNNLY
jgi:hypothetical protein